MKVVYVMGQIIKILIVIGPAIFPNIAFFIQRKKGNPYCWFWLAGGVMMALGLILTIRHYGLEKLKNL
jgi:hypothetical protein